MFDKFKTKSKHVLSEVFAGADGSVFDVVKQICLFISETIKALNERRRLKRAEKEYNETEGSN